jgi:pyruvate/2-oxoglutarate dehydrogenase complex dihydrolipoamide dehydrogenase (E3) component
MEYDFIVIGGGSGGYAAARTASEHMGKVAIIDGARELGGLCILRGCMPSKTLIYAAEILHLAQQGSTFGLDIPTAGADMKAMAARKRRIIEDFASYRKEALESGKFDLYRSFAHFVGGNELELADGTRLRGRKILIATGSVVNYPPLPGLEEVPLWTSDDVLDLDFVPESVIVLGGGTVGCELAQFLRRIGSSVTLVQRSTHILKGVPEDVARVVEQAMTDEGIELFTGTSVKEIRCNGENIEVRFDCRGEEVRRMARFGFNALGRKPDTLPLRLDAAGIRTNPGGQIVTNEFQQTTNPDVYAAGDCCSPHEIVHIAIQQGEVAARHALGVQVPPIHYDHLLQVIFTDPPVATAGLSARQVEMAGRKYLSASYPFNDHGKSILMEAHYGFVRLLADAETGEILGAEIVGKEAGELIHCFSIAITLKATVFDLLRAPWYHPTLAEILTYPLEEIAEQIVAQRKVPQRQV